MIRVVPELRHICVENDALVVLIVLTQVNNKVRKGRTPLLGDVVTIVPPHVGGLDVGHG